MELNQEQPSDNDDDKQDGEYHDYRSRTRLGSRYDTIIALYGNAGLWARFCYWFKDSVLKQSVMLLDKSGLRKKGKSSEISKKKVKEISDEDLSKMWQSTVVKKSDND